MTLVLVIHCLPSNVFDEHPSKLEAFQVLRNAVGVSNFPEKCYEGVRFNVIFVTSGGWGLNFQEKCYVTLGMAP